MAARANYVTVRDGKARISHNNLGAYEILEISVLGPDVTARFLDAWQDLDPSDEWNEERQAEGGLLVDFDRRVLIMFSIYREPALRAAYLDAVTRTWPGWQARWAYDGIADLVAYVGDDVQEIRGEPPEAEALYWREREETAQLCYVVTVGGVGAYGLAGNACDPWRAGPGLLEQLSDADRIDTTSTAPLAGMHLDPVTRTAGVWTTVRPLHGIAGNWARLWPGWTLEFWDDRSVEQLNRCAGAVDFGLPGSLGRAQFAESVMGTWAFFIAEDCDDNLREAYETAERIALQRRVSGWFRTQERTAVTRRELSMALEAITGRDWPRPRWPDFDMPEAAALA
jgi:hypothetical protein